VSLGLYIASIRSIKDSRKIKFMKKNLLTNVVKNSQKKNCPKKNLRRRKKMAKDEQEEESSGSVWPWVIGVAVVTAGIILAVALAN